MQAPQAGAILLASLATGCLASPGLDPAPGFALSCLEPCARLVDPGTRWEPWVAVDPADPLHIVASSHDQTRDPQTGVRWSWALSHVTFDAGATWETHRLPGGPGASPTHPLSSYNNMDDSMMMFLPDGTLVWSVLVMDALVVSGAPAVPVTGPSIAILRSHDGGRTFPEVTLAAEGSGLMVGTTLETVQAATDFHDKQWLALAPDGTVLLAWNVNRGGNPECGELDPFGECTQVVMSTSEDGGLSWSPPRRIHEGSASGAFPIVLQDGTWVVSFRDTAQGQAVIARSEDRGMSWNVQYVADTTKFPMLAQDPSPGPGGRLWMAWPEAQGSHDGWQNVTVQSSTDGGATWEGRTRLDTGEHPGRSLPAIVTMANGMAVVAFWHIDETGAELRAVPLRDGQVGAAIVLDWTEGRTQVLGDYLGLAAAPDGAWLAWTSIHADGMAVRAAHLTLA